MPPEFQPPRVVVLGSLNMDLVARVPRLPKPGETLIGEEFGTFLGGKGLNQAVAAARLGASVALVGQVGNDEFGETLLATLRQEGVNVDAVSRHPSLGTGVASITVAGGPGPDAGDNVIVVLPRANGALTEAQVRAALTSQLVGPPGVLLCQCEIPLAAVRVGLEMARAAGWHAILNLAPVPPLPFDEDVVRLADIVTLNETETYLLTGARIRGNTDAKLLVVALALRFAATIILTLGSAGAYWCEPGGQPEKVRAFGVEAEDSTAAGDAFCGALATRLAAGDPLAEALRWGAAAGALAATVEGALPSLPTEAQVRGLLAKRRHSRTVSPDPS